RLFFSLLPRPPPSTLFPYTTFFRSLPLHVDRGRRAGRHKCRGSRRTTPESGEGAVRPLARDSRSAGEATRSSRSERRRARDTSSDRKSTRLNSSHSQISYAVFCLKK